MRAARDATVGMCERGGEHKGQGLLLRLGGAEGTVVLTCHHVVAAVRQAGDLRVRLSLPDGTLGEPVEVAYDGQRSRPGQDAAVLRIREDATPSGSAVPLLHKLGPDTYDGSLLATVLTRLIPDSFDATVRPSAQIEGRAATGNGWPDAPERYRLRAFRLAEATYSEPGFSGGVVLCEGGVLGLAHFGRTETPHRSREAYLVPLSAWAEGWPALEGLIEPLLDEKLRGAATVKRAAGLLVGIGADVVVANYQPEVYAEREADGLVRRAFEERDGAIVVGRPLSGKSRLIAGLLHEHPRTIAVIPKAHTLAPPESFEVSGFAGEDAVLVFDDLHRTAETSGTLAWRRILEEATGRPCKVVCASRDGADWRQVGFAQGRLLDELGNEAVVFTSLIGEPGNQEGEDLSGEQAWELAEALGLSALEFERRFDGTPGSLLLDLRDMRRRYETLRDEHRGGVSMGRLLDSAKVLYKARLPGFSDPLMRAVVERVRGAGPLDQETWETLVRRTQEEGFIGFDEEAEAIRLYAPYLERCVLYDPSTADFERLSEVVEDVGDIAGLFFLVAFYGHELEDYDRALSLAERAVELNPEFAPSWYNMSFTLNRLGRNDEALEAIERAIHLNPEFDASYYSRGWALTDLGRHDEALEAFREALRRGGGSYPGVVSMYWDGISAALENLGRFYEAVSAGLQSLSVYDPYRPAIFRLCNLLCAAGEPAYALEVAEHALTIDGEWPEAWLGKGLALDELGRNRQGIDPAPDQVGYDRQALEAYERATHLQHDLPESWSRMGGVFLRMCDRALSSDALVRTVGPEDLDALATRFASRGLDAIDTAISLGADQVPNKVNRALLLARLNRLDEALESVNGALELEPRNPAIHHNKATILRRSRRHEEALLVYSEASSLIPGFLASFWPMILLLGGHFDRPLEALEAINHLITLDPDPLTPNPEALFVRGCLLAKLGRTLEARFWIRQARERGGALPLPAAPSGTRRSAMDFLGPAPG